MSTEPSIEEKVNEMIVKQMGVNKEQVKPETSFINDLGADSLDTVELVMELEDAFDINIPDEDAEKIQTVGDAINYIIKTNKEKKDKAFKTVLTAEGNKFTEEELQAMSFDTLENIIKEHK